jgi:small GTP-binding protein
MKMKGDNQGKTIQFKFLVLGEGRIGKTCIIERYVNRTFKGNYIATIGMDIRLKRLEINNNDVNISITDTAGQERFRSITKMFYKGADGILVGFDLTEPNTLEQVNYWIDQIEMNRSKEYPISLVLFGNKYDDKENIKVQEEDIKKMEEKYNLKYFPTSAKDGTNVQTVFEYLTKITLKTRGYLPKIGLSEETNIDDINIVEKENQKLDIKKTPRKKKKKTC